MPHLPIGIQSFDNIRGEGNFVYVDKTELIYKLIQQGRYYFLSRPRRFGKSLLLSTLEALFRAKRTLFHGLWIDASDYTWKPHPVIHFDFASLGSRSTEMLEKELEQELHKQAEHHGASLPSHLSIEGALRALIEELSKINQVVILIDEYDYPIVNHIQDLSLAKANRALLKSFFTVIKTQEKNLRFIFITGVSKFSQVSVFSGLNNLEDITLDRKWSTLLGYTEEEILTCFTQHLSSVAASHEKTGEELLSDMRKWYNGYCFAPKSSKVYNPFSTLMFLKQGEFRDFWFSTGTPSFLIELLKKKPHLLDIADHQLLREGDFTAYDLENINLPSLLVQTGYLTIGEYFPNTQEYRLTYPNQEVKGAFLSHIASGFTEQESNQVTLQIRQFKQALLQQDLESFFSILNRFIANIPYPLHVPQERYYQTIFYTIAELIGINTQAEVMTHIGRIDLVIKMPQTIYLFEFKFNGSAKQALTQIKDRQYTAPYQSLNQRLILVGVSFSLEGRGTVKEWEVCIVDPKHWTG